MTGNTSAPNQSVSARKSKKVRLWAIGVLIVIVAVLFYFAKTGTQKAGLAAIFALLLGAFGMEYSDKDLDLGKMAETGSVSESMVDRSKENGTVQMPMSEETAAAAENVTGNIRRDAEGNPTNIDGSCDVAKGDYNCTDFKTQSEAQSVFDTCKERGDIYQLDRDKDGRVCESLPAGTTAAAASP